MKKHHKITASERDQIARRLALWSHYPEDGKAAWQKPMQGTQTPDPLRVFTAHVMKGVRIET